VERKLAALIDELIEQSRDGKTPDLEAVIRAHPDLASELRELWATAMIAEDFASLSGELAAFPSESADQPASQAQPPNWPGALPDKIGDYELLEEIGRGGMGVVFKARQVSLGRIVALKMILRAELASSADRARFRAEAESVAQLNHPHIVPVYEVGQHNGQPFFSMKYIEGTTLAKRLADGPLPPREAAELLVPVCRAIADAHGCGLLHRDLKPSNILID